MFLPLTKKMAFASGNGFVFNAATRTPYLHHADNNSTSLDLSGSPPPTKRAPQRANVTCD